jgi:hypothetical protein
MTTNNEDIYTSDGAHIREDVVNARKEDVTDIYQKLNSSILLGFMLSQMPQAAFNREDMMAIRNSDPIPNDENVNPYDENYTDYIKELGGHVLVQYDQETDKIKFRLCNEEEGDRMIQEKNCIGFFSIRRPWNIQGWGNSVYKRQFPYVKEENNEQ